MKRFFLTLIILSFSTSSLAQGLPLFDYPEVSDNTSEFGPGGNLEGIEEQISVDMSVPNPQPGQSFTISVISYSSDLNAANISWYTNKSLNISGIGQTSASFVAPGYGDSLIIDLEIKTQGGNIIEQTFEISPALVDLIYETQTYTPPFYKGKSIYTNQSTAIIHALPKIVEDGVVIKDKELIYTWEVNGSVQQDRSGYGKNVFAYNGGILSKPAEITVTVESVTSNQEALGSIILDPLDPEILLVQEHPLYGLLNESGGSITTSLNDVVVHAIPFFFSTSNRESSALKYSWAVNGSELGEENDSSIIAFQTPEGEGGTASINIRVESETNLFQAANNSLNVTIENIKQLFQGNTEDFSL